MRPHLEYCSVVWVPYQSTLILNIEYVQQKFLQLVGLRLGFDFRDDPLAELQTFLNLSTLERGRSTNDTMFLYKILNGLPNCPELLGHISICCSAQTRSRELFAHCHSHTNYKAFSAVERIQRLGNVLAPDVDFFASYLLTFRRPMLSKLLASTR